MARITKNNLIHSFRGKNTKRRDALYDYYQDLFLLPLTAPMLAERISEDLSFPVGVSIIYHIRSKHKPTSRTSPKAPKQLAHMPKKTAVKPVQQAIPDLDEFTFNRPAFEFLTD